MKQTLEKAAHSFAESRSSGRANKSRRKRVFIVLSFYRFFVSVSDVGAAIIRGRKPAAAEWRRANCRD